MRVSTAMTTTSPLRSLTSALQPILRSSLLCAGIPNARARSTATRALSSDTSEETRFKENLTKLVKDVTQREAERAPLEANASRDFRATLAKRRNTAQSLRRFTANEVVDRVERLARGERLAPGEERLAEALEGVAPAVFEPDEGDKMQSR